MEMNETNPLEHQLAEPKAEITVETVREMSRDLEGTSRALEDKKMLYAFTIAAASGLLPKSMQGFTESRRALADAGWIMQYGYEGDEDIICEHGPYKEDLTAYYWPDHMVPEAVTEDEKKSVHAEITRFVGDSPYSGNRISMEMITGRDVTISIDKGRIGNINGVWCKINPETGRVNRILVADKSLKSTWYEFEDQRVFRKSGEYGAPDTRSEIHDMNVLKKLSEYIGFDLLTDSVDLDATKERFFRPLPHPEGVGEDWKPNIFDTLVVRRPNEYQASQLPEAAVG